MSDDDIAKNEQIIIEDCKQLWRQKQICEDGNDPAKPFIKINPNAEHGGDEGGSEPSMGGGGPPELGGAGGPEKGPDLGGETPPGGEPKGVGDKGGLKEETTNLIKKFVEFTSTAQKPKISSNIDWNQPGEEKLNEKHGEHADDYVRPSQKGNKEARDYPFGEDPLGDVENNKHSKADRRLSLEGKSAKVLSYEKIMKDGLIKNLDAFLNTGSENEQKELINESKNTKSLLDEKNIIE